MRARLIRKALTNRGRTVAEWKRITVLGWPVTVQHGVRTMMRTTDLIVAGLFGPAAIAALGLANLYTQIALWIGIGIGTSALALSSQDTGSGADENRNEAVTQALIIGVIIGIPIAILGVLFREEAILVFRAPSEVVTLGAAYLAIVIATAPVRHMVIIGEKALQGSGDTLTPMFIRGGTNILNIIGTVILALGVGPAPRLEIVGIAIATAGANIIGAIAVLLVFLTSWSGISLVVPKNLVIGKQIIRISIPRSVEGLSITAASFPLNTILVAFSVEVYAAYEVGRTVFQQVVGPFARSFGVVGSILTGQSIGNQQPEDARFSINALALFSILTISVLAAIMILFPQRLAALFSDDPATGTTAVAFIIAFAISAPFASLFRIYSGALQGAGETTKPFLAEVTGVFGLLLGLTYVGGVLLDGGVVYAYAGVVTYSIWRLGLIYAWYNQTAWIDSAMSDLKERGSIQSD